MSVHGQAPDAAGIARRRYFPAVEGMRGIAALTVMVGHATMLIPMTGTLGKIGYWLPDFGVVTFFAISGFLLYRPFVAARYVNEPVRQIAPSYLWRRVVRIFPAYWVALTLLALWPGLLGDVLGHNWWRYYGLLQIYSPQTTVFGIAPAWSLCVEISFYVALPVLAVVMARVGVGSRRRHGFLWEFCFLVVLAVGSLLYRNSVTESPLTAYLSLTLLGTMAWFCVGMFLATLEVGNPASLQRVRGLLARPELCWPLALVLFGAMVAGVPEDLELTLPHVILLQTIVSGIVSGLVLAPAILGDGHRLVRLSLTNGVIVFFGTVSYGIYLWHLPVLGWFNEQSIVKTSEPEIVALLGLGGTTAVLLGTASWYLVEKPLMRRARSVKAFRRVRRGPVEVAEPDGAEAAPRPAVEPAPLAQPAPDPGR
ncbi:MAG: acyltransferase [Solirubrobacterales bacterium]